jgi:hypothetical protein
VLETVDRDWVVKPVTSYYAISNAMTIAEDFAASSASLEARAIEAGLYERGAPFSFRAVFEDESRTSSGRYRRDRAMTVLAERGGRLRTTDFFRLLRDHEERPSPEGSSGVRICAHRRDNPIGQTTASWVAELSPGRCVHWVTGTSAPCTALFKPVLLESGLPYHGPKPGAEEDPASLWWRHEQLRRSLDESSESLRDAFTTERNELEARFAAMMDQCPAVKDEHTRKEACGIIETCWSEARAFDSRWYRRLV